LDIGDQIVAVILVNIHGDRLAQIQGENAQDGFGVNYMAAGPQVYFIRIPVHRVYESFYFLGKAELNGYRAHGKRTSSFDIVYYFTASMGKKQLKCCKYYNFLTSLHSFGFGRLPNTIVKKNDEKGRFTAEGEQPKPLVKAGTETLTRNYAV
jgi:hypothetical protein